MPLLVFELPHAIFPKITSNVSEAILERARGSGVGVGDGAGAFFFFFFFGASALTSEAAGRLALPEAFPSSFSFSLVFPGLLFDVNAKSSPVDPELDFWVCL